MSKPKKVSQNIHTKINWIGREDIITLLESVGIVCYDHEQTRLLRDTLRNNVIDGTIDESYII